MRLDCHNYPLKGSEPVGRYRHAYNHDLRTVTVDDEIKPKSTGVGGRGEVEKKIIRSQEV